MDAVLEKPNLENLKKIRIQKKITYQQMAERLGLETHSAYLKKENGERKISLQEAQTISNFLGLTLEDIFFPKDVQKLN